MKKIRIAICVLIILAIGIFYLLQPSPPIVRKLIVREKPVQSEAIVVLLGGSAMERPELALNLYQQKFAPRIVFCDGYQIGGWKSWWYKKYGWVPFGKTLRYFFRRNDISENTIDMIECPKIHDTSSEIKALTEYLNKQHIKKILLVTSASHSRRATIIWKRISSSIDATTVAARDPGLQYWWKTRRGRTTIIYEYLALAKELIRAKID